MRIVSIHIFKWKKKDPVLLCEETQLEGLWFFQKKTAGEHIRFSSRLIAQDTELGMKQGVKLDGDVGMCYCWTTSEGLSVTTITDMEYPESSAFNMLGQIIIDFMSTFEEDSEMYTDAEQDAALKYYNLKNFLRTGKTQQTLIKSIKLRQS